MDNGFSPYESHILQGKDAHVMLLAFVRSDAEQSAKTALASLQEDAELQERGISNPSSFAYPMGDKTALLVYFDYAGYEYLNAARAFESTTVAAKVASLVVSHPRAPQDGGDWLQLEWINYIYGAKPTMKAPKKSAQVTRLKPDREVFYRTLHQSVWPGVCDHMNRAGNHDFSIFLVELEGELYQFFYVESHATPEQTERMKSYIDPTYQRWYDIAAPCLDPLPGAVDCWCPMENIAP